MKKETVIAIIDKAIEIQKRDKSFTCIDIDLAHEHVIPGYRSWFDSELRILYADIFDCDKRTFKGKLMNETLETLENTRLAALELFKEMLITEDSFLEIYN